MFHVETAYGNWELIHLPVAAGTLKKSSFFHLPPPRFCSTALTKFTNLKPPLVFWGLSLTFSRTSARASCLHVNLPSVTRDDYWIWRHIVFQVCWSPTKIEAWVVPHAPCCQIGRFWQHVINRLKLKLQMSFQDNFFCRVPSQPFCFFMPTSFIILACSSI